MFFSNYLGVKGMEQHSLFLYYSSVNLQILLLLSMQQSGFILIVEREQISQDDVVKLLHPTVSHSCLLHIL